jgi:Ca-activated chloride channel family protein
MRLELIPERPCLPIGEATSLPILIRLTAPAIPQMAEPLNLCLVIDRSGSMANEKLRQTIASVKFVVARLAPATDILSVISSTSG